ncbi:MAG TPA: Ig-like domain-containing protein [Phycisphaerae bacterium]|nr:Ig-like domain-containing protein [Phycisphaerae bacterium]
MYPSRRSHRRELFEHLEPRLLLTVTPSLLSPDLDPASDTGFSNVDDYTANNNASPAGELTFRVQNALPGASLFLYADGALIATRAAVAATALTSITTDGTIPLADGHHDFTLRQQLDGEDLSAQSGALTVTIQATPPIAPDAPTLPPGSDTGVFSSDGITRAQVTQVLSSVSDNYYVMIDGALNPQLQQSQFIPTHFTSGTHTVQISYVDPAGVQSPFSAPLTIQIVTANTAGGTAALSLDSASDSGVSNSDRLTNTTNPILDVALTGQKWYQILDVNSGQLLFSSGYFSSLNFMPPTLTAGTHSYQILTRDLAGNPGPSSNILTITVATQAPTLIGAQDLRFTANSQAALATFSSISATRILSSGKILVAGELTAAAGNHPALARLNSDGSLDTSFAAAGLFIFPEAGAARTIALQSDGQILIGLETDDFAIARLSADGLLDTSFATAGYVPALSFVRGIRFLQQLSDGNILAAVSQGVLRLTPNGLPDPSFASQGLALLSLPANANPFFSAMALSPSGQILLATSSPGSFSVLRLNADGSLDTSFADNGYFTLSADDPLSAVAIHDLAFDSSGNLLVAACLDPTNTSANHAVIMRLNDSGQLDTSFGNGGIADLPGSFADSIALLPDDSLLVRSSNTLYHLSADGALDNAYLSTGLLTLAPDNHSAGAPLSAADGAILVPDTNTLTHAVALSRLITDVSQLPPILLSADSDSDTPGDNITSDTSPSLALQMFPGFYGRILSGSTVVADNIPSGNFALGHLADGTYAYTLQYLDAAGNPAATTTPFHITVRSFAPTLTHITTTLAASATSLLPGHSLTLTATVSADLGDPPAGAVIFLDNNIFLGASALTGNSAVLTLAAPASGAHHYTAIFSATPTSTASSSAPLAVTVAPNHAPFGTITSLSAANVTGWAYDPDLTAAADFIRIDIDGKPTAFLNASLDTPALASTLPSTHHGFSYNFSSLSLGRHHVQIYAYNFPTPATPAAILIADTWVTNHPASAGIQMVNAQKIIGWAYDADAPAAPVMLYLQIDNHPGTVLSAAPARPDTAVLGNGAHGFTYTLTALPSGTHHITLYAFDTSGAGITWGQSLTIRI